MYHGVMKLSRYHVISLKLFKSYSARSRDPAFSIPYILDARYKIDE